MKKWKGGEVVCISRDEYALSESRLHPTPIHSTMISLTSNTFITCRSYSSLSTVG